MTLETFAPTPRKIAIAGRTVSILPLTLGRMPAFSAAVKTVGGLLFVADYLTLLSEHSEDAARVIIAGSDVTPAEAEGLDAEQAVELLAAIYEVNADFFISRLRPAMTRAAEAATSRIKAVAPTMLTGATSSPGLSSADTPSTPASA